LVQDMPRIRQNTIEKFRFHIMLHVERIRGVFCDDALYKLTFTFT